VAHLSQGLEIAERAAGGGQLLKGLLQGLEASGEHGD
jgi:hypothetical protein